MCDTEGMTTSSLEPLTTFRKRLYTSSLHGDETRSSISPMPFTTGPMLSPAHLSLASSFQRGWGSVYDALVDGQGVEKLLGSWTAPRKIRRLKPCDNINQVAEEHIKELLQD
jgi:hypothetical protein